jgi:hypothetical protein
MLDYLMSKDDDGLQSDLIKSIKRVQDKLKKGKKPKPRAADDPRGPRMPKKSKAKKSKS